MGGIEQIYWCIITIITYLVLAVVFRPWRHVAVNSVDVWVHFCLLVIASLMIWFSADGMDDGEQKSKLDKNLSRMLIAFAFLGIPITLPAIGYMFWQQATESGRARKDLMMNRLVTAILS